MTLSRRKVIKVMAVGAAAGMCGRSGRCPFAPVTSAMAAQTWSRAAADLPPMASRPVVITPWSKKLSFTEAYHYSQRHHSAMGAGFMQVLRIVEPVYETRAQKMCELIAEAQYNMFSSPEFKQYVRVRYNIPTEEEGAHLAGLIGDQGDEMLLMAGRVNQFDSQRVEKELDTCPWDIVGSELCRATIAGFATAFEAFAINENDKMSVEMVEAKGWGDLHCRVVAENRIAYDHEEVKEVWELVGPPLHPELINFTPREECFSEPMALSSPEGVYRNYFGAEWTKEEQYAGAASTLGSMNYIIPVLRSILEEDPDGDTKLAHITRCVFEGAGKMAFAEPAAIKGVRDWLGVPPDLNDGRVLGALVSVVLQSMLMPYNITEFTPDRTVIEIGREAFLRDTPELEPAYGALWKGMAQTLISAEWSAELDVDAPDDTLRLVIERKVDKYR